MYFELGAKLSKDRPVTVEMKAYGDADTREQFEHHVVEALNIMIDRILAAKCDHHEGPFESKLDEPL